MKYQVDEENRWLMQNEKAVRKLHKQWCFQDDFRGVIDRPFEEIDKAMEDYAEVGTLVRRDDLTGAFGYHYRFRDEAEREARTEEEDKLYREARRNLHITHLAASHVIDREIAKMGEDALSEKESLLRDRVSACRLANGIRTGAVDANAIINAGQALALAVLAQEHLLIEGVKGTPFEDKEHEEQSVKRWFARRGYEF